MNPEIIGYIAAILTTLAYIPQTIKVVRSKHTTSLSLVMYTFLSGGVGLWLVYGILIESPSLILANSLSLMMIMVILLMKIRNG
jgi:MtN3 and saliva related transmembrane protein